MAINSMLRACRSITLLPVFLLCFGHLCLRGPAKRRSGDCIGNNRLYYICARHGLARCMVSTYELRSLIHVGEAVSVFRFWWNHAWAWCLPKFAPKRRLKRKSKLRDFCNCDVPVQVRTLQRETFKSNYCGGKLEYWNEIMK